MIAAPGFIIVIIIFNKKRSILGQWVCHSARASIRAVFVVQCALGIQRFSLFISGFFAILCVKISFCRYARHIIHGRRNGSLDSRINRRGIQRHTSPAANTDNTDFFRIHAIMRRQKIDCGLKIFGIDIGRSHIARASSAFPRKGRVKRNG